MQKRNCKNKQYTRKAFTLIELLIVIAIIGILFVVLISKVDFATDRAKISGVQTDFRSFQMALETVAREHQGFNDLVHGDDYSQLEMAINKNLDNKLKIDIDNMGNISMANGATDPWSSEYHGYYLSNDGSDRGAIIIYSNGADKEFGSTSTIKDGEIISISGDNIAGKDDLSISVSYNCSTGKCQVDTHTNGFSPNQKVENSNSENNGDSNNGGEIDNNEGSDVNNTDTPFVPSKDVENRIAGLYKTGTNTLIYSWDELVAMNIITSQGRGRGSNSSYHGAVGPDQDVVDLLAGDLQFPNTLTYVPDNAFYKCKNLTGVILPESIVRVDDNAFDGCGLNQLVVFGAKDFNEALGSNIPNIYFDNETSLLNSKYYGYLTWGYRYVYNGIGNNTNIYINGELLEHLVVPDTITTIAFGPLYQYTKLKTVTLPASCTTINTGAFHQCSALESINLENVQTIGIYAFYQTNLTSVSLDNIVTLRNAAFSYCENLTSISLGNNLTTIEYGSLASGAEGLEVYFNGTLQQWYDAVKYAEHINNFAGVTYGHQYKLFLDDVELKGELILPSHWINIKDAVFSGVSGITSLVLHDNVQSIGEYSFLKTNIENLDLGNSLQEIGSYAFSYTPVKYLNIPDSVITLGERAFYYCTEMLAVNINETSQMTTMGDYAFCYCTKIKSLFIPPLITRLDAHGLVIYANSLTEFNFSPNTQLEYLNVSFGFVDYVTVYLPDSVKTIKDLDINVNYNSKLIIGENSQLERIEGRLFDRYFGKIYIPKNLYYISESWASLQFSPEVTIHPENKYFKYESGCLIDIENKRLIASNPDAVIPTDGSVTSIGRSALCYNITYIPKCITSINSYAWDVDTNYYAKVVYEGTMEEWRAIQGTGYLSDFKQVTCLDGILNSNGEQIG